MKDPKSFFSWMINSLSDGLDDSADFAEFQGNPVAFGEEVLGETYTDDVKTLMESVRDNPVTVAISANATGKTHGAARVGVWFYKTFPHSQIYTGAAPPESNLKKLLWGEIGNIVETNTDLFKSDVCTKLHVQRSAQSFLTGVTIPMSGTEAQREAKFSGKHAPHLLFIIDEGDAVPDEVYKGIESCMSGGHARMLVMFNPRAEVGEAYRMIRDGKANVVHLSAFNHPNVITGEDRIPGAVTRETTVRRINEWCRPLADGEMIDAECFELPEFLEGVTAKSQSGREYSPLKPGYYKIMEPAFSYMVLGQYPAKASNQLISKEWISRARSRWDSYVAQHGEVPPSNTFGVMGQDVGEFGADENVACFRYGGYVERLIAWGGLDRLRQGTGRSWSTTRERSSGSVSTQPARCGNSPLHEQSRVFRNTCEVASRPTTATEIGEFYILRDQLWWSCREWLKTDPGLCYRLMNY